MTLGSAWTTLRHNPALFVALAIPLLSVLVAATLLTFSLLAQRDSANAAAATQVDMPLPPMSKTSWREPLGASSPPKVQPGSVEPGSVAP